MLPGFRARAAAREERLIPDRLPPADAAALRRGVGIKASVGAQAELAAIRRALDVGDEIVGEFRRGCGQRFRLRQRRCGQLRGDRSVAVPWRGVTPRRGDTLVAHCESDFWRGLDLLLRV